MQTNCQFSELTTWLTDLQNIDWIACGFGLFHYDSETKRSHNFLNLNQHCFSEEATGYMWTLSLN